MPQIHLAPLRQIDPATLYRILQLRTDVFVVEQQCAYPELDGRDLEPDALVMWADEDDRVVGTLRILAEPDSMRIGRVAVAPTHRSSGLGAQLMGAAVEHVAGRACVLDAQAHLQHWYERFGFEASGPGFDEDGIPHVPMRK